MTKNIVTLKKHIGFYVEQNLFEDINMPVLAFGLILYNMAMIL